MYINLVLAGLALIYAVCSLINIPNNNTFLAGVGFMAAFSAMIIYIANFVILKKQNKK